MKRKVFPIVSATDYDKAVRFLEELAKKGEADLTEEETELLQKTAEMAANYEQTHGMTPIPLNPAENLNLDTISALLGYTPDLIQLVEFKMFQNRINQATLAIELQMPPSKISLIMNRKREPDIDFLKGIHEKLGIDGNVLLEIA